MSTHFKLKKQHNKIESKYTCNPQKKMEIKIKNKTETGARNDHH